MALKHIALLLTSSALTMATPTMAQTQAPPPPPAPSTDTGEIVVTAQKRSEGLQHVPISIQALGEANLKQHQVVDFDDYVKQLPSVSFQSFGPGQSQLFFRGITSGGDGLPFGALPTSGVYVDETPVTTIGNLLDVHIYDVSRIEALSGPQGTLYGASSLSGTMRIITNKPDPSKFYGGIDLTGDKYGRGAAGGTAEGFVNIPLNPNMALRAVGYYEHDGGYIDNTYKQRTYIRAHTNADDSVTDSLYNANNSAFVKNNFNDVDTYGGRLALGIDLDDGWTITPEIMAQHQRANGSYLYDPKATTGSDLIVHDFAPEYNIDEWYQASLTVQGKIGNWDVLYNGGYMGRKITTAADYSYYTVAYDAAYTDADYFKTASGQDINPTQYYYSTQKMTKQTHELRVSSPVSKPLRLTAGMFLQRQSNQALLEYYIPGISQNVITSSFEGNPVYGDTIFLTNVKIIDRDYAMFGQASYDITSKLNLTAGIRGFIYNNTLSGFSGFQSAAIGAGCAVPLATLDSCSDLNKKAVSSGETHKVNLTWQIDHDRMVYATYSTGFRPGGNNRFAGANPYKPDTLDNFELGWKTSWFDHKLTLNGAVYYEKWHNLQYGMIVVADGGITNIFNAGNARVYGAEVNATLRPVRGLTISASGAYNDAALTTNFCVVGVNSTNNCTPDNITATKGTRLPVQPRFKIDSTIRYDFPIDGLDAHIQGSMLHQSSSTSFLSNQYDQLVGDSPGFTTFDFAVGASKGKTSMELFIQNAFNERGQLSHNIFTSPLIGAGTGYQPDYRIYPIKPQYFGVKLSQKF